MAVITRWGTQYRLILSLINNKDALKRYAHEFGDLPATKRIKQSALVVIKDKDFWAALELMRELLQPLDEALRMSESTDSNLGHVLPRWMAIAEHLKTKTTDYPDELASFMAIDNETGFSHRYKRQIIPLHIVAYYLLPETRNKDITEYFDNQLQAFFRKISSSEADHETLCYEFESFRAQEPPFECGRRCWSLVKSPKLFWHAAMSHTTSLGKLGYRIFSTPCNSVASERAFSTQNLIHTKTRNQLKPETADKLAYIHINGRILNQFEMFQFSNSIKARSANKLSPEEEVQLENILLDIEREGDNVITSIIDNEDDGKDDGEEDENDDFEID